MVYVLAATTERNAVLRMTFGEWLREQRTARGWSASQLAEKAGLTQPAISQYEAGERNPKRPTVIAIANALGADTNTALSVAGFVGTTPPPDKEITLATGDVVKIWGVEGAELVITDELLQRLQLEAQFQDKSREKK